MDGKIMGQLAINHYWEAATYKDEKTRQRSSKMDDDTLEAPAGMISVANGSHGILPPSEIRVTNM